MIKNICLSEINAKRNQTESNIAKTNYHAEILEFLENEEQVKFKFSVILSELGYIELIGGFDYVVDNKEEIKKMWDDGKMQNKQIEEIYNVIIQYCLPITVFLSKDLKMLSLIPLPHLSWRCKNAFEGREKAKQTKNGRMGQIKNRVQVYNPKAKRWVKMDTERGRIISVKSDKKPYKGIRKK
jgi:hypothetical protein